MPWQLQGGVAKTGYEGRAGQLDSHAYTSARTAGWICRLYLRLQRTLAAPLAHTEPKRPYEMGAGHASGAVSGSDCASLSGKDSVLP